MYMVCVKYRLEAASLLQSVSFVVSLYLSAFDISQGLVWFLSAMDVLRYAWNAYRGNQIMITLTYRISIFSKLSPK